MLYADKGTLGIPAAWRRSGVVKNEIGAVNLQNLYEDLDTDITRSGLGHFASLCICTITLIEQPLLSVPIALIAAYILAVSTGSIIGLTYIAINCPADGSVKKLLQHIHMKLGMNIGLAVCYAALLFQSARYI